MTDLIGLVHSDGKKCQQLFELAPNFDVAGILGTTYFLIQSSLQPKPQKLQQILKLFTLVSKKVWLLASQFKACFTISGILL